MKKKLIIVNIIIVFFIVIASKISAATGNVEFKASKNEVKKGETFTVTLSASSENGINGIDTKCTYDTEKLELIKHEVNDSNNWVDIGTFPDMTVICNSTKSIKSANIYTLTFRVKENVEAESTIKIVTNEILLDTDLQTNSEVKLEAKKIEIKVKKETEEKKEDSSTTNNEEVKKETKQADDNKPKDYKQNPNTGILIFYYSNLSIKNVVKF